MTFWIADLRLDLRFALRASAKRPGFAAVAVLTLALGIGAATAVFSIVDAVLLRPLPYKDPDRLAAVWVTSTREQNLAKLFAVHQDYAAFRHAQSFESLGVATWAKQASRVLTGVGPTRHILAIPATASFFDTLGVSAQLGRTFRPDDESVACSLLIGHRFWTSTLGADPSIVGRTLTLDDKPCAVVGVMPETFTFYPRQTQAWVLLGPNADPDMQVGIFGRLKPGVTHERARAELRSLYRAIHTSGEARDFEPVVFDLHGEFTFLAGRTLRTTLLLVFGAVLVVLLIACLNVANLFIARLAERRREIAVRAALGSGQGRLVRQLLAEAFLLSTLAAVLGVALASGIIRVFRAASPIELSPGADLTINLPVLAFAVFLSALTAAVFATLPAFRASRVDLAARLKSGGRGLLPGSGRLAGTVVAAEVALSFALLSAAGLFLGSAFRMSSEPLGFDPDGVAAARLSLPATRYRSDADRLRFWQALLDRVGPAAAVASKVPPEAGGNQTLDVEGRAPSRIHEVGADAVSLGFFDLLRMPVLRGRSFTAQDTAGGPPVVVINRSLADKYFPGADPIGQRIRIPGGMPWLTVVGVVSSLKHTQLMNEMNWVETPILYRPLAQEPRPSMELALRGGPGMPELQRQLAELDPAIPVAELTSLRARLSKTLAYPRFRAAIFGSFAFGALLLSAVGLHGVLSRFVTQRTSEFGVRRAVGAQTRHLLLLVARQGGIPVLGGLAAGLLLTGGFRRILSGFLYGVEIDDLSALAAVAGILLAVAALAIAAPAIRAALVDPMTALRDE